MAKLNVWEMIYIGYYGDFVLAASTHKKELKSYMKDVRGLSKDEYEIREIGLDNRTIDELYGELLLETWHGIPLTQRDIVVLEEDIRSNLDGFSDMLSQLEYFDNLIQFNEKIKDKGQKTHKAVKEIKENLTTQKFVTQLYISLAYDSVITSGNISEYLRRMGAIREERTLRELFLNKLYDDSE